MKCIKLCKQFLLKHVVLKQSPWPGSPASGTGPWGWSSGPALSSSQPAAFLSTDSILINIATHKADTAAAEILQPRGEGKKKKRDVKSKATIACTGRVTGEEEDTEFTANPYKNKTALTFKLTELTTF